MRPSIQELCDARLLATNDAERMNKVFFDEAYQGFLKRRQNSTLDLSTSDEISIHHHFRVIEIFMTAKKSLIDSGPLRCAEVLKRNVAMVHDDSLSPILRNLKHDRPFIRLYQLLGLCVYTCPLY